PFPEVVHHLHEVTGISMDPVHLDHENRVPSVPFRDHFPVRGPSGVAPRMTVIDVSGDHRPIARQAVRLEAFPLRPAGESFLRLVLGRISRVLRSANTCTTDRIWPLNIISQ